MTNHFELFNLPIQFDIDHKALDEVYRKVQQLVHPDKYVNASDVEKRMAIQWASQANDAYHVLRNPLKRGIYLCELHHHKLEAENNVMMPPDFLIQQIEWREMLENARTDKDFATLEKLDAQQRSYKETHMQTIADNLRNADYENALQNIRKMMFLEKFSNEIHIAFDEIEPTIEK